MLTQEEVKRLFYYNPNMGQLVRRVSVSSNAKVGDVVGTIANDGYRQTKVKGRLYKVHRLIWLYVHGEFPPEQIDHINGIRDDNRLLNLREVSHQENNKNRRIASHNKSGVIGVCWYKRDKKWHAQIAVPEETKHLGYFTDFDEAVKVRKEAEAKYGYHENHGREK
jgi:hypothetical protein